MPALDTKPEKRLGAYRLLKLLGEGAFGSVWLAERLETFQDQQIAVRCALKVKHRSLHDDDVEQASIAFMRDWFVGNCIQHKNVVRILNIHTIDGDLCVAMELVDGFTFDQILSRLAEHQLTLPRVAILEMGLGACAGLAAIHGARNSEGTPYNIVHRDIKPSNLMVDKQGDVRVLDLGIARGDGVPGSTETGMLKGTARYMAPEQHRPGPVTQRADLYALGVVLYELATGEMLFRQMERDSLQMSKQDGRALARLDAQQGRLGPLHPVLYRCLQPDPKDRYPSASALASELEALLVLEPRGAGLRDLIDTLRGRGSPALRTWPEWAPIVDALDQPLRPKPSGNVVNLRRLVEEQAQGPASPFLTSEGNGPLRPPPRDYSNGERPLRPFRARPAVEPTAAPEPSDPGPAPLKLIPSPPPATPWPAADPVATPWPAAPPAPWQAPQPPPTPWPAAQASPIPWSPQASPLPRWPPTPVPQAPPALERTVWEPVPAPQALGPSPLGPLLPQRAPQATPPPTPERDAWERTPAPPPPPPVVNQHAETLIYTRGGREGQPDPPLSAPPKVKAPKDNTGLIVAVLGLILVFSVVVSAGTIALFQLKPWEPADPPTDPQGQQVCDVDPTRMVEAERPCNGQDDDCDGQVAPAERDADGDHYLSCTPMAGDGPLASGVLGGGDCEDGDPATHPGAAEVPGDPDRNCDGTTIPALTIDADADQDGTPDAEDCAPTNAAIHPGAKEITADGKDSNCDGMELCFEDADGDGHGATTPVKSKIPSCIGPKIAAIGDDCDEAHASAHPGAAEVPGDHVDNDCDGRVDPDPPLADFSKLVWNPEVTRDGKALDVTLRITDPDGICKYYQMSWSQEDPPRWTSENTKSVSKSDLGRPLQVSLKSRAPADVAFGCCPVTGACKAAPELFHTK